MDQITAIEDAIILRVKSLAAQTGLSFAVLPFPDKKFEEYEPLHNNGEILVAYTDETDGDSKDICLVVQERELFFELTFVFSSLRTTAKIGGLYAHLEAVRGALTGFKPESCTKKTRLDGVQRVQRYKKRWWQYTQTWKFTALNIEEYEEETGPNMVRITVINDTTNQVTEVSNG